MDFELDLKACRVRPDTDLFEQVWQNLFTNAIKYSNKNDQIEVKMVLNEQGVNVHINNTGQGVSEEDLPYIFNRFYMVDKARSHSGGGNGLGLSIVKKIIELHGCKISVKSKREIGTCFTVTIPIQ